MVAGGDDIFDIKTLCDKEYAISIDILIKKRTIETIINRQFAIADAQADAVTLPKQRIYAMCNLRGGIGKTTLSFNLSYLVNDLLAVDTCPQGNLSYFYDSNYYAGQQTNVKDMLQVQKEQALKSILYSLQTEIKRELSENNLDKCLIDTSPFFAGATQLAWYAADALVIPVRTDQQSIKSLDLLINTLSSPQSEFRKYLPENDMNVPKIQMVVLTHCGWSTVAGARNEPNQQTKVIDRVRVSASKSVDKCKNQLNFIAQQLW